MSKIGVIGLGYVGLPLALRAEKKGFDVVGIDLDKGRIAKLKKRQAVIDDRTTRISTETKIAFSDDFSLLSNVDIAIVCVPTPVDNNKNPNLNIVSTASLDAARYLKKGSLLVIESTINPGVCDEVIIPLINKETEHTVGKTIHIAHCPERINPGDPKWHVGNIDRVLGANDNTGLDLAYAFYSKLIDGQVKKMANIKEAEACKIVENSFRDINIAFVNELAKSFDKLGINLINVINGAATKPFAFMAHYPGIGVGGHCIPVDPYYLIEYARNNGFEHKFLSLARSINESMPVYAVTKLEEALIQKTNKTLDSATVTVLGLSYKPNIADDRESPAYTVIDALQKRGAKITIYDPCMPASSTAKTLEESLANKDAAILVTGHKEFLSLSPKQFSGLSIFLDGRNIFAGLDKEFAEHGVRYIGLGLG